MSESLIAIAKKQNAMLERAFKCLSISMDALAVISINKGVVDPAMIAHEAIKNINLVIDQAPTSPKADPSYRSH